MKKQFKRPLRFMALMMLVPGAMISMAKPLFAISIKKTQADAQISLLGG
jgi:hypothetical protein